MTRRQILVVGTLAAAIALAGCATVDVGTSPDDRPTRGTSVPASTSASATPTAFPGSAPAPPGTTLTVEVLAVIDGDTVVVERPNGSQATVRLVGIDAPETGGEVHPREFGLPETERVRECLRRAGRRAAEYVRDLLVDHTVTLAFDPESDRRGYYGRLLAYVYVGGDSLGYELIERGLARTYDSEFAARGAYQRAEARAHAADRGLWGCAGG